MANSISFKNLKKQFLTVEFEDDTVILVRMPKKGLLDDFFSVQEELVTAQSGENTGHIADDIFEICAKVMSCNKAGKVITKEYLEEIFDIEDIIVFFKGYGDFVSALANAKN